MDEQTLEHTLRVIRDLGALVYETTKGGTCDSERQAQLLLVLGQIAGMADRALEDVSYFGMVDRP